MATVGFSRGVRRFFEDGSGDGTGGCVIALAGIAEVEASGLIASGGGVSSDCERRSVRLALTERQGPSVHLNRPLSRSTYWTF